LREISSLKARVHIWIPDYASATGGIQAFSRFLIRAVGDCLPDAELSVFSKNDISKPIFSARKHPTQFYSAGRWKGLIRTGAFVCRVIGQALRDRPNLILSAHVNFTPVAYLLKRLLRIPYVAVGHGIDVWNPKTAGAHRALQYSDRLLAVSHFTRDRMIAGLGIKEEHVGLLPNTFEPEAFFPSTKPNSLLNRFGLTPEQPVILTVARLASEEQYKGYDQVLHALPAVKRGFPSVRYVIGGSGPDRLRVEALINELDLQDTVILAGYIPEQELSGFYNLCDVFAMPSKGEGFGIVFLEAMACGKPVIAGNKDGSVDAVLNGKLGVLIDPDNLAQLEDTLVQILAGEHPLEILREPERLRAEVISAYGYRRFVKTVADNLAIVGLTRTRSQ
jgi:glycosyltransferase involved in cell wall biosynthesis